MKYCDCKKNQFTKDGKQYDEICCVKLDKPQGKITHKNCVNEDSLSFYFYEKAKDIWSVNPWLLKKRLSLNNKKS